MWVVVVNIISVTLLTTAHVASAANCPANWFDCGNGKCIAEIWHCDGDNDCINRKDEQDCENMPSPAVCLSSQFECKADKHCIPEKWHCDGEDDCDDGSDEAACGNATECTGFLCHNRHCIPEKWRCDGNADCSDGSDEEICPRSKLCTDSEFLCSSGSCINKNLVCDKKNDCKDGSDEGPHCGDPCENATCSQLCKNTPAGPQCYCNDGYSLDRDNKTCSDINECLEEGFCSHYCTNTAGGYRCSCRNGYDLDNRTCKAKGADPLLVFTTLQEIRAMQLRSGKYFLVRKATYRASAVDVDPKTEQIYWVEISNRSSVFSAKIDGSGFRTVLSHGLLMPEDIAVDYVANNLYLTDSGLKQVLVCKMDGTMCSVLHDRDVGKPRSIVLDLAEGFVYWSDWGEGTSGIYRSGMDGSRRIPFVSTNVAWPNGIAIDHSTSRLYWADAKLNTIEYMSLNGSSRKAVLNATVFHPYALAVFEDTIYWSDWSTFSLESCNKFTGHKMTLLARENGRHIMGVHVYHPVLTATKSTPCWSNDCSHMCLISPNKKFTCACPNGFLLGSDEKTCTMQEISKAVFVSEGSSVFYVRPAAVGSETITELPLRLSTASISRVSYDGNLRYLFVADISSPAIYAVNMTSLNTKVLVRSHMTMPEDLSLDSRSNNLYWLDSGKETVEVVSLDNLKRVVILENLNRPVSLALSPANGLMFIATLSSYPSVHMYDMDGKRRRQINSVQGWAMSIALHPSKTLLYWADPRTGTISFVDYTNQRSPKILASRLNGVMSVAVSEDVVYWTTSKRELNLLKANVTHILELPGQEKGTVTRKVTYIPGLIATGKSECLIGNGGCSYLCLTSPHGRSCACPSELVLADDNVTCIERPCEATEFKCMNGRCLSSEMRCDGSKDCEDGSDEVGCVSRCNSKDDFQCKNGRCILKSWLCDRRNDCADNSDEEDCPPATNCTKDHISCLNGQCVPIIWKCDGEADCEDGSDEQNCHVTRCNLDSHYRCDSGQCIPISWVCDGAKDCHDNSDEKNCSRAKSCTAHEFKCENDDSCIDEELKCDGRTDCSDGSDERNCPKLHSECKKDMYRCADGTCIYNYEVCDGHGDCSNNEEEINCTHTMCQTEEYLCPSSKRCILKRWICDGDLDCTDGSDEENCADSKTQQPKTTRLIDSACESFYCYSTAQCLPWSKVCDGSQDCRDLSDEGGLCSKACSRNNGGCSHVCRKTPYGPRCLCNPGYRLLPDNKTCDDINECLIAGSCSHYCNNTRGGFKCSCAEGYVLHNDHRSCKAEGGPATMVYLLGDRIRGYDLHSHNQHVIVEEEDDEMEGMDYDAASEVFFWTEKRDRSIHIFSPKSNIRTVIARSFTRPTSIRYDWIAQNLYVKDGSNTIVACTKDGRYCKSVIELNELDIDSMDISPTTGLMFWTVWANPQRKQISGFIQRAEMDGSHRIDIVSEKTIAPTAITVDHVSKMIYWSDKQLNTLECVDFHGFMRRPVVQSDMYKPLAVAVFEDNVYWADWGSNTIVRCNKFTGQDCEKVTEGNIKTHILFVVHKAMQPPGDNKCLEKNCTHFCLPTRLDGVCVCDKMVDNESCELQPNVAATTGCPKNYCPGNRTCVVEDGAFVCLLPRTAVVRKSRTKCPKDYCQGNGTCIVKDGELICKCLPQFSGRTCEVKAAAASASSEKSNSWIIAVFLAILVTGIIILSLLMCFRNREKLHRVGESVSVKFRNTKHDQDGRLVLDTDDGNVYDELVLEEEDKSTKANSERTASDSEDGDFKKWPNYRRDVMKLNNNIAAFFRKMKLNASML